jgi:hypothetical protein
MRYHSSLSVTPSNTADIRAGDVFDGLRIGTAGDGTLRITDENGVQQDYVGVTAGIFPISVKRVHSTGTGVSNIHALKI